VTGASRGIGRAIAAELSRTHQVIASYKSDQDAARSLAQETGADMVRSDVSSATDRAALIQYARGRFESLDLLVNNAGIAPRERRDVLEASEESFDELVATNLKGPHFLTALAARWMLERGCGRIVFITSISAYAASVNRAEYCISKAGLSMSASLYAQRLAAHGIQVFEIRPGIIRTDMTAPAEQAYAARIEAGLLPQPRMGDPGDVARVVRAIADGLLDYSTGQTISVDGGFQLRSL
jgi:NAD(P)-dependent dehydrogenase (short-subunit alcohol dehydrogenase family)